MKFEFWGGVTVTFEFHAHFLLLYSLCTVHSLGTKLVTAKIMHSLCI